ncbi:hypothetical protein HGB24_02000, partial [Candidatus Saccharibacteria bacterium]|nr:hypothetical protein [Candidatus Saccharibacteria bacterium]
QDNSTLEYLTEVTAKFSENNNINIDPTTLVTIDGCATDLAVKDIAYVREQFAKTRISYGLAPVDGKSSYVNEHNEIEFGEMPKNRESIVIDFGGGKFLYVLLDCGNLVTYEVVNNVVIHKTVIIVENTIIKKTTNSNHSHNRHQHERTSRKNNDDPSTRGRSDTGSGQNTDRSAGDYQSQSDVAKPK